MMYRFEPLSYLLSTGLAELGAQSWNEIGVHKELFRYNPNWPRYAELERENVLRFVAVRDDDGILIGYASIVITPDLHDRDICCAIIQDIYIDKQYRRGLAAIREFINFLKKQLASIGVRHITVSERETDPRGGIGPVWKRLGFSSAERLWSINLEAQ